MQLKNPKFANTTILSTVAFFLFITFYELFYDEARLTGLKEFLVYYGLPAICLFLLFALFRLNKTQKANLAVVLISTALIPYALEAGLNLVNRDTSPHFFSPTLHPDFVTRNHAAKRLGIRVDPRTKLEVIEEFEKNDIVAWPSVFPSSILARNVVMKINNRKVFPLGGISNVMTVYCHDSEGWVIYQSDEHGFHNPQGLYDVGSLDVAIVGDSFAQGDCVRSEENAAAVIRKSFKNTLNFGTNGSGPLVALATLKEFVTPFKPKIVLWFYFEGNDLYDLAREKKSLLLLEYLKEDHDQDLFSMQEEVDRQLMKFVNQEKQRVSESRKNWNVNVHSLFRFLVLSNLRTKLRHAIRLKDEVYPFDKDLFHKVLLSARNITHRIGGQLYFVYLPSWERFSNSVYLNPYREQVLKLVNNVKVPIIDMCEVFSEHDAPLTLFPFRLRGHYTRDGYSLVATTILSSLADDSKN